MRRRRAATVLASGVAAGGIWLIATFILGHDLVVERWDTSDPMSVGLGNVVTTVLIAGLGGWATRALADRLISRAALIWTLIASIVLAASLGMPAAAATTTATAVTLILMHVAVGGILIAGLGRSS
jgi:hypothetical protein